MLKVSFPPSGKVYASSKPGPQPTSGRRPPKFHKKWAWHYLGGAWQSGSQLVGGGNDLRFADRTKFDLNLFADLDALPFLIARDRTWTKSARLSLDVENLFDSRDRVADANGATPLAYQSAFLDPLGRTIRFSVRKQL